MLKKIILVILTIICSGCTIKNLDNMDYDSIISSSLNNSTLIHNTNNKGYRYYLPRGFSIKEIDDFNNILINNQDKYYLYVDAVSYYNKTKIECKNIKESLYYKTFNINNKDGYLNILQNNGYFFVEMMYNYAIIEVKVKEKDIKSCLVSCSNVLSSIQYNYLSIENIIKDDLVETKITKYEFNKPKEEESNKDFLQVYDKYDNYEGKTKE
ncbi:MAG: hypothetical protein RR228_00455 [Bacilli bacterium]